MTVTFDHIDAFLRAALFAMEHGYPDAAEVSQVADDLREQYTPRADSSSSSHAIRRKGNDPNSNTRAARRTTDGASDGRLSRHHKRH
jgi:hypothetical protein